MRGLRVFPVVVAPLIWSAGCARGLESGNFQTRVIRPASPEDVFRTAQVVLRREFGPLEVDRDAHRIDSRPEEYRTATGSGTARDLYGGWSTMRRVAHFSMSSRSDGVVVRLRVDLERQDTSRREIFQPESHRLSDTPDQTPIQRDAATTARQNTVWTFVKRDQRLERALLAELQEQFAPAPIEAEDAQPAERPLDDSP